MSLDALVHEVDQALGDARGLFGSAPTPGGWGIAGGPGRGRDAVSQASGRAARTRSGAGGSNYVATSGGRVAALDSVIDADAGTTAGLGGSADTSARGRGAMEAVVNDARAGVAAIAPSTDTLAGRQQLVNHLRSQLQFVPALAGLEEDRVVERDAPTVTRHIYVDETKRRDHVMVSAVVVDNDLVRLCARSPQAWPTTPTYEG
jgi:hypothetical protein